MNKEKIKITWRVMMRKIRQQWEDFTDDELSQIQGKYEDRERKLYRQLRNEKLCSKILKV